MTEFMGTISGPLPAGADPQGDKVGALIESLMEAAEAEDYEPIGGGDGTRGVWTITVTVGDNAHCGWNDAFDELRHLADDLPAQFTGLELVSYEDPLFRD